MVPDSDMAGSNAAMKKNAFACASLFFHMFICSKFKFFLVKCQSLKYSFIVE